jgi:hypothetical protein
MDREMVFVNMETEDNCKKVECFTAQEEYD